MTQVAPVTVLYFAGSGRSGTTLINGILGSVPGVFAGGEFRFFWERGVQENHLCSCGQLFDACPLWTSVMADLRDRVGTPEVDAAGIGSRILRRLKVRAVPAMMARWERGAQAVEPHPDDRAIEALYLATAHATGAQVLVDSSKLPPYGMLLAQQPAIDLRVLHVVRDSRATAFSWMREKKALDHGDDGQLMPRLPIGKSAFLWLYWNLLTVRRWRGDSRYLRVRYEDFVANPRQVMATIATFAGLDPARVPFTGSHTLALAPGHVVAGNPNRHSTGEIRVRPDDQWREAMKPRDAVAVTAVTAPGLRFFGYPLRYRR